MRLFIFFLLIVVCTTSCNLNKQLPAAHSRTETCDCFRTIPTQHFITYHLRENKQIVLCADKVIDKNQVFYTHAYVRICNSNDSLSFRKDQVYSSQMHGDTLLMNVLFLLPLGLDYKYAQASIFIEKVFINQDHQLQKMLSIHPDLPRYTQSQILDVFEEYQLRPAENDEQLVLLIDKLLMSALSGNQMAMKTFRNFEAKYKNMKEIPKARYEYDKQILKDYLSL